MRRRSFQFCALIVSSALLCLGLSSVRASRAFAQEKHATAAVDKTKMGPYRALARLAYASFEKGDNATASELAQILERVWDKSEDYGGETALSKTNPDLFKQVDKAMDDFIAPLIDHEKKAPDASKIKSAFNTYLEKLRLAD